MKYNKWFADFGMNVLIKYKYIFLIVFALVLYLSFAGLKRIVMDNSYKAMLEKDNPISIKNDYFQEIFGNNDYIYIMVEADNTLEPEVLSEIRELSADLENNLPFVKNLKSFTNIEFLEVDGEYILANKLIEDEIPNSDSALLELKRKVKSKQIYQGRMSDSSLTQTGIFIRFNNLPDSVYISRVERTGLPKGVYYSDEIISKEEFKSKTEEEKKAFKFVKDPRLLIAPALYYLLEKHANEACEYTATGVPVISYNVNTILQKESGRSFAITLIVVILMLAFIYRSIRAVVIPVFIILSSVVITFGIIGWLNIVVSTFALIVALLLLVISIGYSIHVLNHFRRSFQISGNRKKAIQYTYEHSGWPCFITALTTVIGFASFIVVDMVPVRNLGITSAIGVSVTFLLVIFLLPVAFSFGKDKVPGSKKLKKITLNTSFMQNLSYVSLKNKKLIFIGTIILLVFCSISIFSIKADTDFINLFGDKNKFVRDARHSTENIGSLYSYEVLIELPESEMAKEPEVLMALERLDSLINSFSTTKFTTSINDLIKDINQTMHQGDESYFTIPKSRELIAQYLLLYEIAGGEELENCVDYEYYQLRNSVRINRSTTDLKYDFENIKNFSAELFPEGTQVSIAGDMSVFLRAVSFLVRGQINSIILAFIGILIVLIFTLKSFKLALLAMIPNIIPVFILIGIMGPLGITLNLQTIVAAPVIMGLAVDDTVHYFLNLKNEFKIHKSYAIANRETFIKVGWALVNTSLILLFGFLSFLLTSVNSLQSISILLMVGVATALLADLLIAPVLFIVFKPFGEEQNADPVKTTIND